MPDIRISELPAAATPADADLAPLVQSSGATLETRRATVAQLRSAVLADRGAHVRDYGAVESDLSTEVHEHDLERAEDTVQELERLDLWPR